MAKSYIGVNNVSKRIKYVYVGDSSGKSKQVKKIYVGVNGVAKKIFPSDYKVTTKVTGCTVTLPATLEALATTTTSIMVKNNYSLPDSVEVTGAQYIYTKSTATLIIYNATDDITVTIKCISQFTQVPVYFDSFYNQSYADFSDTSSRYTMCVKPTSDTIVYFRFRYNSSSSSWTVTTYPTSYKGRFNLKIISSAQTVSGLLRFYIYPSIEGTYLRNIPISLVYGSSWATSEDDFPDWDTTGAYWAN